jgi:hypothetical protein
MALNVYQIIHFATKNFGYFILYETWNYYLNPFKDCILKYFLGNIFNERLKIISRNTFASNT